MRKPIQIAVTATTDSYLSYPCVYALCDDGTIWMMVAKYDDEWEQVKPIPQDEDDPQ